MRKKSIQSKSASAFNYSPRSKDLPATQGMLQLVRTELKADMRGLRAEMKAGFSQVESRFNQMDSKIECMASEVARIGVLVEEQNANNRIVLEGLTGLWQCQERAEGRVDDVEQLVRSIVRSK